ncbi:MAG TPA: choice-of-anchor P family protein [Ktedonosporobacter sp.]|nr:choice-of-anchor P family protein [Ktedonosporobacter sp.]
MKRIGMLLVCLSSCLIMLGAGMQLSRPTHADPICPGPSATPLGYLSGTAYISAFRQPVTGIPMREPYRYVHLGCGVEQDKATNAAVNVDLGLLGGLSIDSSQAMMTVTASSVSIAERASVGEFRLFGGLIRAQAIEASAESTATATEASSKNTSAFGSLTIAGIPIALNPQPNTKLNVPGIGIVTLNKQTSVNNTADQSDIAVTALDIVMGSGNVFHLPEGTHLEFAHVESNYSRKLPILPAIPTLPVVPTLPALPTLPAVPTLPALPTLPAVPTLPALPTLPPNPLNPEHTPTPEGPTTPTGTTTPVSTATVVSTATPVSTETPCALPHLCWPAHPPFPGVKNNPAAQGISSFSDLRDMQMRENDQHVDEGVLALRVHAGEIKLHTALGNVFIGHTVVRGNKH